MTNSVVTSPIARQAPAMSQARRRLAKRKRAETRFRFYGLASILAAGAFLCTILADICIKAWPAFTRSEITLDVPVTTDLVDRAAIRSGDFQGLVRNAVRAVFPAVTARADRKALDNVIATGAADELREKVVANPALIGTTVKSAVLLSSDADLLSKGVMGAVEIKAGQGNVKLSQDGDVVTAAFENATLAGVVSQFGAEPGDAVELGSSKPSLLVAINGGVIKAKTVSAEKITGEILVPLPSTDAAAPGTWQTIVLELPESQRHVTDKQAAFVVLLQQKGLVQNRLNFEFLTEGDSREPEQAGILGALVGSALTMLVTLGLCLPLGVAAAIYLEEFAPKNRFTHLIEININNLAAVPSIVFGLLGLAIFLNVFGLPRSSSLVGGLVLALLVLPTIIIASRAALKSVPPSIMDAALALGATRQQAVFHHVLPLAMPGIMTGTIIGMAHALGETAPLLMIGMVAFIADVPKFFADSATVLPVQIFLWSVLPEAGFRAKTAAAIVVLLLFLILMNSLAIYLRRKFERRW